MKIALQVVVLVIGVVALYALPAPSPDSCPEGEDWSCVQFIDADAVDASELDDAALTELIAANSPDAEAADSDAENDDGLGDGIELTSNGVLEVDTDSAEFEYELLSGTKWSHELLATADDQRVIAVTYEPDEVSPAAPRIMHAPPTRLQIIDFNDEEAVFDDELPEEIVWMGWLSDNRLVLGSDDGSVTVFELS